VKDNLKSELGEGAEFFKNIGRAWKAILILVFTGILLSFFFIWLMSNYARCMAICSIVLLLLGFYGGGAACILGSLDMDDGGGLVLTGVVLIILGLIFTCQIWCYRHSLETAIAIIDASADFFMATKRIILMSLMFFMISLGLFVGCILGEMVLVGLNDFKDPVEKGS
jgi:hypothetical protein